MDPGFAFALGVVLTAIAFFLPLLWLRGRLSRAERAATDSQADAARDRGVLAAAPDGLYLWDDADGREYCSRRLAVLLDLEAGTEARIEDILFRFEGVHAASLHQAIIALRRAGSGFELTLPTAGGRRTVRAMGVRAAAADGRPLADLLWVRDTDAGAPPLDAATDAPSDAAQDADRVRAMLDALPIPLWLRDADLHLAFANRAAAGGLYAEAAGDLAVRARQGGGSIVEPRLVNLGESSKTYEIAETPLGGDFGTVGYAVEPSAAAPALGAGDGGGTRVLENLRTAVAIYGADHRMVYFNPAFAALWQLDGEWLGKGPDLGQVLERLRELRRLPETADFRTFKEEELSLFRALTAPLEDLVHLPDGATLHRVVSRHPDGGLVFTFEDVSDRLDLERSYNTSIAVQQATLDNLYEGVGVFGSDGRLKLSNPAFAELWDTSASGADGADDTLHIADFVERMRPLMETAGDWEERKQSMTASLMSRQASTGRIERTDGQVLEYANVPLPDGAVLLSYLNITDRFHVEQALRQRAEAMSEADRLKSEFIAHVSHEIRTPLTSIMGFAEILAGEHFGALNARQAEYGQGIIEASQGLMTLVEDILDLATIEAGMMTLELDTVDLHSALAQVLTLVRERARQRGLELEFDCPPQIGWIVADARRLKQVAFNLLSNAIQFTPAQGVVRLSAERAAAHVTIAVADTGSGIPQADQDRVFRSFEHAAGHTEGAGLGLSLVRRFVELHGGHVDMQSVPGKGTTVICTFPTDGG